MLCVSWSVQNTTFLPGTVWAFSVVFNWGYKLTELLPSAWDTRHFRFLAMLCFPPPKCSERRRKKRQGIMNAAALNMTIQLYFTQAEDFSKNYQCLLTEKTVQSFLAASVTIHKFGTRCHVTKETSLDANSYYFCCLLNLPPVRTKIAGNGIHVTALRHCLEI